MMESLSATAPIFMVVGLGWAITRAGFFRREDLTVLSRFVARIALPLLTFINVSGHRAADVFNPTYLLTYAVAALGMFALAFAWGRALHRPLVRSTFMGMAMSGTNSGFVGFALFLIIVPEVAGLAVSMDMIVDNVVVVPLTLLVVEHIARNGGGLLARILGTLRAVATHPLMIAIAAALLLSSTGASVPPVTERAIRLVAQASSGVALIVVGGLLVNLNLRESRLDVLANVVAKLVAMPLLALGVLAALEAAGLPPLTGPLRAAAILTCALPPLSVMPAIAEPYGEAGVTTATVALGTAGSFVTLTVWLEVLTRWGWL